MLVTVLFGVGALLFSAADGHYSDIHANPPHCTNVTKGTDYVYHYRFDYPVAYIHPGQKEVYQQLYCTNPPAVSVASTIVCDWAAPPQVQFTLGDDYMHVVRQDPAGRFAGNALPSYQRIRLSDKCNFREKRKILSNSNFLNVYQPIAMKIILKN